MNIVPDMVYSSLIRQCINPSNFVLNTIGGLLMLYITYLWSIRGYERGWKNRPLVYYIKSQGMSVDISIPLCASKKCDVVIILDFCTPMDVFECELVFCRFKTTITVCHFIIPSRRQWSQDPMQYFDLLWFSHVIVVRLSNGQSTILFRPPFPHRKVLWHTSL